MLLLLLLLLLLQQRRGQRRVEPLTPQWRARRHRGRVQVVHRALPAVMMRSGRCSPLLMMLHPLERGRLHRDGPPQVGRRGRGRRRLSAADDSGARRAGGGRGERRRRRRRLPLLLLHPGGREDELVDLGLLRGVEVDEVGVWNGGRF